MTLLCSSQRPITVTWHRWRAGEISFLACRVLRNRTAMHPLPICNGTQGLGRFRTFDIVGIVRSSQQLTFLPIPNLQGMPDWRCMSRHLSWLPLSAVDYEAAPKRTYFINCIDGQVRDCNGYPAFELLFCDLLVRV
jgi:hypothetical protein